MRTAILGCGGLGAALAKGLLAKTDFDLALCDRHAEKVAPFVGTRARPAADARSCVEGADVVVLAVKPKGIPAALAEIDGALDTNALVVSCAAGVPFAKLEHALTEAAVARAMPNIGASVGAGTTAVALGRGADPARDRDRLERLFRAIGVVKFVTDEGQLHAVTAVAASAPAWLFLAVEALVEGGVEAGLPRADADAYAAGALRAAAALLDQGKASPAELRAQVTSPGGTTVAGLAALERSAVRAAFMDAVRAAVLRSKEIAGDAR